MEMIPKVLQAVAGQGPQFSQWDFVRSFPLVMGMRKAGVARPFVGLCFFDWGGVTPPPAPAGGRGGRRRGAGCFPPPR